MRNISLRNYRIKKRWRVESDGNKVCEYYTQYRSRYFGWMYFDSKYNLHPDIPLVSGTLMLICAAVFVVGLLFLILPFSPPASTITTLLVVIGSLVMFYISCLWALKTPQGGEHKLDEAKQRIAGRIKHLEEKVTEKIKRKQSRVSLEDDETIYLSINIERYKKLKRINKRFKL